MQDNEYRRQRIENMNKLEAAGYPPYGSAFTRTATLEVLHETFEEGKTVRACGRIVAMRKMGKMAFAHLSDGSAKFQLMVKKDLIGEEAFAAFKLLDLGDIIGVKGELFITQTQEQTVRVGEWNLLSKSLLPMPEKFHGLQDVETRYRQRELDLIVNEEVMDLFKKRTAVLREIRAFLAARGYLEVETPMIQQLAGGAAARPFQTRYHALGTDMFFRIAPELYLKRLIVGGMDKVFEMNRNFRNEGLDRTHNPEFTALEIYEAYGDMRSMQELVQSLTTHLSQKIFGRMEVEWNGSLINLSTPWKEIAYRDLIREHLGADWFDSTLDEARAKASELDVFVEPEADFAVVTHEIYEKTIEGTLIQPTFVTRLPAFLVPLANPCADDPSLVDVFELIIGGKEIAPAYSELNDALEQRRRFEEQAGNDPSKIDQDFLTSLEYGMPPTGGMGIGIDRLMMLLTGSDAIRDVILFPQLKPRKREEKPGGETEA
ncbi:MAG: lysyl-tRNA synthetase, class [Verrucomicrobiota bacterium]|jgi:lysyl-tRNA synthetase class 2|nr:lysyl-tRNA synthetase, class [Verrucomicrobiota bacterium]MDK2963836.1 lysyl-tRNA synthetase, class [Verrucomicrobiota bacterium]